jgi:hypothetical protein
LLRFLADTSLEWRDIDDEAAAIYRFHFLDVQIGRGRDRHPVGAIRIIARPHDAEHVFEGRFAGFGSRAKDLLSDLLPAAYGATGSRSFSTAFHVKSSFDFLISVDCFQTGRFSRRPSRVRSSVADERLKAPSGPRASVDSLDLRIGFQLASIRPSIGLQCAI